MAPNASIDKVNAKIKNYIKTKNKESNVELFLQNYGESYLYSDWDNGKAKWGTDRKCKSIFDCCHYHFNYCLH
jgi:hypothetical protein